MAVDFFRYYVNQELIKQASELSSKISQLSLGGQQEEAVRRMREARLILEKVRGVDALTNQFLEGLEGLGIEQPPISIFSSPPVSLEPGIPSTIPEVTEPEIPLASGFETLPDEKKHAAEPETDNAQLKLDDLPLVKNERRARRDLGEIEERVAFALFAINREGSNFAFPTYREVAEAVYEGNTVNTNYVKMSVARIFEKFETFSRNPDNSLPVLQNFYDWLGTISQYSQGEIPIEVFESIALRKISFEEFEALLKNAAPQEPSGSDESSYLTLPTTDTKDNETWEEENPQPILNFPEIDMLCQVMLSVRKDLLKEAGLGWQDSDFMEIEGIAERLGIQEGGSDMEALLQSLRQKLAIFLQAKEATLVVNADNEAALALLFLLSDISSQEHLDKLFASFVAQAAINMH